jgi:outer membrane biosynthesis protein TonB
VELVVSAVGEVESVKQVSGQTTVLTSMQISTVKAWRFEPATLDGQPVRYRLRVRLPVQ